MPKTIPVGAGNPVIEQLPSPFPDNVDPVKRLFVLRSGVTGAIEHHLMSGLCNTGKDLVKLYLRTA
jgi:hypothetical protein